MAQKEEGGTRGPGYPAARTPMDNPLARQVQGAMRAVTGDSLLLVPSMGGSLTHAMHTISWYN